MKIKSLLIFIIITMFTVSVYATEGEENKEEWTDFSGVNIEILGTQTTSGQEFSLKLTNLLSSKLSSTSVYYVFLSNEKNITISEELLNHAIGEIRSEMYEKESTAVFSDYGCRISTCLEKSGEIYATIVERKESEIKKIIEDKKVERPKLLPLGSRIKCYFFSNKTSTFFWEARNTLDTTLVRKVNLKIGTIDNQDILLSIKNGEANCLQKLMDYTKSAPSIYTNTVPIGESTTITSDMNLVNEAYYYVYMEMEDEGGKYYPIEDVSLYQASIGETVGKNLYDYLSDEFKWNIGNTQNNSSQNNEVRNTENSSTNNPPANPLQADSTVSPNTIPFAGFKSCLFIIGILIIAGIISVYKYHQLKDI